MMQVIVGSEFPTSMAQHDADVLTVVIQILRTWALYGRSSRVLGLMIAFAIALSGGAIVRGLFGFARVPELTRLLVCCRWSDSWSVLKWWMYYCLSTPRVSISFYCGSPAN